MTLVIPLWADLLAVGVGALQGALFAAQFRDRRIDLLGVAVVGIASGFGGGLIRDVLLVLVPATLESNWYLPTGVAAALIGMLLERVFSKLNGVITVLDALTIGLFGAIGTTKALALGLPAVPSIFVGVLSAVGGSILRDILLNLPIALMHVGSLYAVAALLGSTTLVISLSLGAPLFIAAIVCVTVTFGVRVLAILFNWQLPEQRRIESIPRLPRMRRMPRGPRAARESQMTRESQVSRDTTSIRIIRDATPSRSTGAIRLPRESAAARDTSTGRIPRISVDGSFLDTTALRVQRTSSPDTEQTPTTSIHLPVIRSAKKSPPTRPWIPRRLRRRDRPE
ncbi:MAG: hypothetical protein JWQ43_2434 [Glaciihabitans sp.]|nr:hypothetical protein [Glaciihabitans sp.]